MFSDIVQPFDPSLNALYRERDARRAKGLKIVDLISGNVNRAGLIFPPALLKQALAMGAKRARIYAPDPLGQPVAREAVSAYYREDGLRVPADQIVLTPGTSLSYWYLFKLLANPGDEILCPKPSYPLLDSIAELSDVKLTGYCLIERDRWSIDFDSLKSAITARTRVIVLISPHNPTGAVATPGEIAELVEIAAKHHLSIISDEVFSAFVFNAQRLPRPASKNTPNHTPHPHPLPSERGEEVRVDVASLVKGNPITAPSPLIGERVGVRGAPLVFTLNGVSKMFALPGLKIGWIAITGESSLVKKAAHALDLISDTFLPVHEAAQFALPMIFKKGKAFLARYQQTVERRMKHAVHALEGFKGLSFAPPEGGFYMTVRLESRMDEESLAMDLLRKDGVLVHPGYFYDLEGDHLVFSFVSRPPLLKSSLKHIFLHTSRASRQP